MNRAYIAAPIFTPGHLSVVAKITAVLDMHEFEVFSPYEASREIWKGRAPDKCTQEERDQVIKGNVENLHWADTLVAWVGGQRHPMQSTDTGVVWELGYFRALINLIRAFPDEINDTTMPKPRKFTLVYIHPTDVKREMNLMLAGTVDAITYGQAELSQALVHLKDDSPDLCREKFAPSKRVLHEREPIG